MRTVLFYAAGFGFFLCLFGCAFFAGRLQERDRLLDGLIAQSLPKVEAIMAELPLNTRTEATVLALTRAIYHRMNTPLDGKPLGRYERLGAMSPLNTSAGTALKHGGFGLKAHSRFGPCTTMSRTLILALKRLGIPARALYLEPDARGLGGGHQIVEFLDGGTWKLIAPSDNAFTWRQLDGSVATVAQIVQSSELFAQIYEKYPHYPYLFAVPTRFSLPDAPILLVRTLAAFMPKHDGVPVAPLLFHSPRGILFRLCLMLTCVWGLTAIWLRPSTWSRMRHR